MKILSDEADLSEIYTNHCIHATVVINLDKKGFQAKDIMATIGHRSETNIKSYSSKCPVNKCREMSDALAEPLITSAPKKQKIQEEKNITEGAAKPDINENQFPVEEIDLPDDTLLDILTLIENENKIVECPNNQQEAPKQNSVVNVSNVANIANVNRRPLMPTMYFPNSNVTINCHFT